MKSHRAVPSQTFSSTNKELCLALLQMRCVEDTSKNFKKAEKMIREAAEKGAEVVILPELFMSEYFCQSENHDCFSLAESIPGPTTRALSEIAKALGVVIVASLFECRAPGLYHNTAAIIDADGAYLGKYRKMHIPDDPQFYEKFYFTPGDLGFCSWSTKAAKLGVLICWDQWYPEAARVTALRGAEILCYPTAIGWHPSEKEKFGAKQREAWILAQRAHALANGVYVAAVNRIGHESPAGGDGLDFWGSSFVAAPDGSLLAQASEDEESVLIAGLDLSKINTQRTHWPFLRDRRIDAYQEIDQRYLD